MQVNAFKLEEHLAAHECSAQYLLCCSDAESFGLHELLALGGPRAVIAPKG